MKTIKAIIVDDEGNAIKNLKWEIENFCPDIEVCDTFTNPEEAISAINYLKPDCVFLDIEMPEMDGFQLLSKLSYKNFDLIITTAYDNYAIKAFKANAIDYLLKPIDSDDLIRSIAKVKANKDKNTLGFELKNIIKSILPDTVPQKISLPLAGKMLFVEPVEILYCKSDGNYTEIYFTNATKEVISKKIKDIEQLINVSVFFRVHNSYLVNTKHIKEFIKNEGSYLILIDGSNIPVSRAKKNELLHFLNV